MSLYDYRVRGKFKEKARITIVNSQDEVIGGMRETVIHKIFKDSIVGQIKDGRIVQKRSDNKWYYLAL